MTDEEHENFPYDWFKWWARDDQLPPQGNWRTWLLLAGRGFGKTRTGAEFVRNQIEEHGRQHIALVAPTAADVRDVMVEGESGILSVGHPDKRPVYEPSKRRLTWPNGAVATTFSADEPERLRGPQHDVAWCDEVGCLIAGTIINTEIGPINIEHVVPGAKVWTRRGLRRVLRSGSTLVVEGVASPRGCLW